MKFFYVIKIHNPILRTIVDGIRLLSDQSQKHTAHITVRGPYESERDYIPDSFEEWQKAVIGTHVRVIGIDTFFNVEQNTVFFKCESTDLKKLWWKKHFKNYSPHITIYDKKDREWASQIIEVFDVIPIDFTFKVYSLEKLISDSKTSPKIQGKLFDKLYYSFDFNLLSEFLGVPINWTILKNIDAKDRLSYIKELAQLLSNMGSGATSFLLSKREKDILSLLSLNKTYEEIATELDISLKAVNGCRQQLLEKFGVPNQSNLIVSALQKKAIIFD